MSRAQCYDINGDIQEDSYPCNSVDGVTVAQCCNATETCMSNGLCHPPAELGGITPYYVNGCTDPDWGAEECLDTCLRIPNGGQGIADCGAGYYCCYGFEGCECTDTDATSVFSLPVTRAVATIPPRSEWEEAGTTSTTSTTVDTSSSGVEATGITTATTLPTTGASAVSSGPAATDTALGQESEGGDDSNVALGAGLGAGLGVAVLGLIGVGVWVWRRRRQRGASKPPTHGAPTVEKSTPPPHTAEMASTGMNKRPFAAEMAGTGMIKVPYAAEMPGTGMTKINRQAYQELDGHSVGDRSNWSPIEMPADPRYR